LDPWPSLRVCLSARGDFVFLVIATLLYLEHLKFALQQEARDWIVRYGQACNAKYRKEMNEVSAFIEDIEKRLSRKISDLEDIRLVMLAIKDLRDNEIRIDMSIAPIDESYTMLQAHGLSIAREEIERAESLKLAWEKLQRHCVSERTLHAVILLYHRSTR
jgi:dynein heavy chain, axonemal